MSAPKPPCYGCAEHREGCHGICLYYRAYAEKMDAIRKRRGREQGAKNTLLEYLQDARARMKRRRHTK